MSTNARVLCILQARVSSSRLPGKVLLPLQGEPMLARQIERVLRSSMIDELVIATSQDSSDDAIQELCESLGVPFYRGSLDDVLARFVGAMDAALGAGHVVRLTGDCPLTDPAIIDRVVRVHLHGDFDYTSNTIDPTYPDGLDVEVVRASVLRLAAAEARLGSEREHVTLWVRSHRNRFRIGSVVDDIDRSSLRWTVDEPADYEFVRRVYDRLYPVDPCFDAAQVLALLAREPELGQVNQGISRNEGLARSIAQDGPRHDDGGNDV